MKHTSSGHLQLKLLVLAFLYSVSGVSSAVDGNNPWNEPRVGPADSRQMSSDKNTWSESSEGVDSADSSKYPPMDEDATLGIEPTQHTVPAAVTESPVSITPSAGTDTPTYAPATGTYGQMPDNYGYAAPYSGSSGQYRNYPDNRYQRYRNGNTGGMWPGGSSGMWPGNSGGMWPGGSNGMWPGSSGGMWPGNSGGSGFPFGGSNW